MHRKITSLWGEKKVVLGEWPRAVTAFGGLSVFVELLTQIGFREQVRRDLPVHLPSPNALDPGQTFTALLISVVAGARRFAHTSRVRADRALHALLGMQRFPPDGTIRNLFKRFTQGRVVRRYEPLGAGQRERLPKRAGGYRLDLDSTVFEGYGRQEGVKRGCNPRKPGRGSHPPLLAVLGEAYFILHGWLGSGNTAAGRGVVEFLKEALAKRESREWIRGVRADSGFFAQELLQYLESLGLRYIVVARMTSWLKREAGRVPAGRALDTSYAGGAFPWQRFGWDQERRFVVGREQLQETKRSPGRKLWEVPGYPFRVFVTNLPDPPEAIWRDDNPRACVEQRIEALKSDLGADDFCLREFFATEAMFLSMLLRCNRRGEFQRARGLPGYRQPASLRVPVLLCGAILGRAGHPTVLHLSAAWGGLAQRNALFAKLLLYEIPTSRKLEFQPQGAG